jgi:hypothetical protein
MTLSTKVAILAPTDAREIFDFLRPLVETPDSVEPEIRENAILNPPGIGASAWLWVHHGPENGAQVMPRSEDCDSEDEDDREYYRGSPRYNGTTHVLVDFDTTYGYQGDGGESCSDLHARLVTALGQWLDARGVPWKWQNEYTGEWFDRFDSLDSFGNAHRANGADAWFRNTVMPAITGEFLRAAATDRKP